MSANGSSGIFGLFAGKPDGESVEPLRDRINSGWFEAEQRFQKYLDDAAISNIKPWAQPDAMQTLVCESWVALVYWQYVRGLFEASILPNGSISDVARNKCIELCQAAEDMALSIVQHDSLVQIGTAIPRASLSGGVPSLQGFDGAWGAYEAVQVQVFTDLHRIEQLGVPKRYLSILSYFKTEVTPLQATTEFLMRRKHEAADAAALHAMHAKIEQATQALFVLGQRMWAPYLLGNMYESCRTKEPSLDDLDLPGFGPWDLTDPEIRLHRQADKWSQQQLVAFWGKVLNKSRIAPLITKLNDAAMSGKLKRLAGSGFDNHAPWPAKYVVLETVTFDQRTFSPGDMCAIYVNRDHDIWVPEVRRSGKITAEELRVLKPIKLALDIWTLVDPSVKKAKLNDAQIESELAELWSRVSNTDEVKLLELQLATLKASRKIRARHGKARAYAPWPTQYLVRSPITLGTRTFECGDLIAAYVVHHPDGSLSIEMRRSGQLTSPIDMLGS